MPLALSDLRPYASRPDPRAQLAWAVAQARRDGATILETGIGRDAQGRETWHLDVEIPEGHAGTAATIRWMERLAAEGERDPRVIDLARTVTAGCPPRDRECMARAIHEWVRRRVKYVNDPVEMEHLQPAAWTALGTRAEDCDGHGVLLCAMSRAVGIPCAFRTVGRGQGSWFAPARFEHVYPVVGVGANPRGVGWVGADTTVRHPFGWEPAEGVTVRRHW